MSATSTQELAVVIQDRRAPIIIESLALAIVAADVVSTWGVDVSEALFYHRDVTTVLERLPGLSDYDRTMLEWAITDNLHAYCAWVPPGRRSIVSAANWAHSRPAYLNPLRYKYQSRFTSPAPSRAPVRRTSLAHG